MSCRILFIALVAIQLAAAVWGAPADAVALAEIPDVHFAVFRLDQKTVELVAAYEFSQPYRKTLPDPHFATRGQVYIRSEPPSDFGFTEFKSRLTGRRILYATTVWTGVGGFGYPTDSLIVSPIAHGFDNPQPDTVNVIGNCSQTCIDAWASVQDSDVIHRLAAKGGYELVVHPHSYDAGGTESEFAEWIFIAHTHPEAPPDGAIIAMPWPHTLITAGEPTVPELTIHNFSDGPIAPLVRFRVIDGETVMHEEVLDLGAVAKDTTVPVAFGAIDDMGLPLMTLRFTLEEAGGRTWLDAYPANDTWETLIEVTDLPVFREQSTYPSGSPADFDGDGDWDIIGDDGGYLALLQNDGAGSFTDVTDLSDFPVPIHVRRAVCEDFDGDHLPDLLLVLYQQRLRLLKGDGTGVFVEVSAASGVSTVTGYWDAEAADIDGDDDQDLVIQTKALERVLENDGAGHFTNITSVAGLFDRSQTEDVALGDLDDDGFPDVVLTNWNAPSTVYLNDGTGTFRLHRSFEDVQNGREGLLLDYDGDGLQDILFVTISPNGLSKLYWNTGNAVFVDVSDDLDLASAFHADTYDLNLDRMDDIILSDGTLLVSRGGRHHDMSRLLGTAPGRGIADPRWVDIDNDGFIDVYGGSRTFVNMSTRPAEPPDPEDPQLAGLCNFGACSPNPVQLKAMITYKLNVSGRVRLTVHDVGGRRVRTLVDDVQRARVALYRVSWDGRSNLGSRIPSGIYFYRLVVGGVTDTRRAVLVR